MRATPRRPTPFAASLALATALAAAGAAAASDAPVRPWPTTGSVGSVESRFAPPAGFRRVAAAPGSFAAFLRALPLRPAGAPVRLHDGRLKRNQAVHAAVVDID